MAMLSGGLSDGSTDRGAPSVLDSPVPDSPVPDAPNGKVIYVNSAQVKAAQLVVDLAKRRREAVDPAVLAIANAKRVNGYAATPAAAGSPAP